MTVWGYACIQPQHFSGTCDSLWKRFWKCNSQAFYAVVKSLEKNFFCQLATEKENNFPDLIF